jgi:hypothetical protein
MQTTYKLYSDRFAVGQITDTINRTIDGNFAAETVIDFGKPVKRGTDKENQVKILDGITAGLCIGFAVRNDERATGQYEINSQVDVLRQGRIAVTVKENVTVDADAYVYADATIGVTTASGLKIGKFNTAASLGGLAELQINLL